MAKPDLGAKRQCQNCGAKFFDLNRNPAVCPKCGTLFQAPASNRMAARPVVKDDAEEPEAVAPVEIISLEDADAGVEKAATATGGDVEVEEDEDATSDEPFLEEEEDDADDVADLIDGDIEDDEEH